MEIPLTPNDFSLQYSGSFMEMDATELNFSLSGASQLLLNGLGEKLQGTISGASLLSAFDFLSAEAKLTASGASNGKVNVSSQLDVNASGASLIIYKGNPQLEVDASGESVVKPAN